MLVYDCINPRIVRQRISIQVEKLIESVVWFFSVDLSRSHCYLRNKLWRGAPHTKIKARAIKQESRLALMLFSCRHIVTDQHKYRTGSDSDWVRPRRNATCVAKLLRDTVAPTNRRSFPCRNPWLTLAEKPFANPQPSRYSSRFRIYQPTMSILISNRHSSTEQHKYRARAVPTGSARATRKEMFDFASQSHLQCTAL
jgi:hypothetical protein